MTYSISNQRRATRGLGPEHVAAVLLATLAALSCEKNTPSAEDAGVPTDSSLTSGPAMDAGVSTGGVGGVSGTGGTTVDTTVTGGSSLGGNSAVDAGLSGGVSGSGASSGRGGTAANPGAVGHPAGLNPGHIGKTGTAGSH